MDSYSCTVHSLDSNTEEGSHLEETQATLPSEPNWNEKWVAIKEQHELGVKHRDFSHLAQDFEYAAQIYSKIIISELFFPDDKKTIKPNNEQGGIAGGKKYVCVGFLLRPMLNPRYSLMGILFKVALDYYDLYGSDEKSMKVAGHELRGLMCVLSCGLQEINVPLMTIIDYRGYRILALSLVPIRGNETIVSGTSDAGVTIHDRNPQLASLMGEIGSFLNLKPHTVKGVPVSLCADFEGHLGLDQRFYLLDFARIMPPESPTVNPKSIFYELLRPELVHSNPQPLNSDAFTGFLGSDYKAKGEDNLNVIAATKRLRDQVIPSLAEALDKNTFKQIVIKNELHNAGVNIRHLGLVRGRCQNASIRSLLLSEMVARVLKEELKRELRGAMQQRRTGTSEGHVSYFLRTIDFLNARFSTQKQLYWSSAQPGQLKRLVVEKFGASALSESEMSESYVLHQQLDLKKLLKYFQAITGVELKDVSTSILALGDCIILSDLIDISTRIKSLNIVSEAKGMELMQLAIHTSGSEVYRLLELSNHQFEESTTRFPSSWSTYRNWGSSLKTFSLHSAIGHPISKFLILSSAKEKLFRAYELRKRSFATEDYSLNYEIIFVCIHMTLYETLVRFRLPSFKITNSLAQARQYAGFFAKLNAQLVGSTPSSTWTSVRANSSNNATSNNNNANSEQHFIFRTLREDMQQYGFFFICCFLHIYYPIGALSPPLVDAIEDFFIKRSESSERMEEARLLNGTRKCTHWQSQSETDTGEQSGLSLGQTSSAQRKLLTMSIPRCDFLNLVEDACVMLDRFRTHVQAFSLYFSEAQYPNITPFLSCLGNSNLQSVELVQMHSLGDFKLAKIRWPATLTRLHILCSSLTDQVAAVLFANNPSLTDVNLSGCNFITQETVRLVTTNCKKLRVFSLGLFIDEYYKNEHRMAPSLSDKIRIASLSIVELVLDGIVDMPPPILEAILNNCPNLINLAAPKKKDPTADGYPIALFSKMRHLKCLSADLRMRKTYRDEETKQMEVFGNLHFTSMQRLLISVSEDENEKDARYKGDAWVWSEFQEWWERITSSASSSISSLSAKLNDGKKHKETSGAGKKKTHAMKLKSNTTEKKVGSSTALVHSSVGIESGDSSSDALVEGKRSLLPTALANSNVRSFLYTTIRLSDCSINDAQFSILILNSPALSKLVLRKCILLTATSLDLLKNCSIVDLQFQAVPFASDDCVARIISGIGTRDPRSLTKFKFQSQSANPKLICAAIGRHCQNLKSLILSETKVTEETLQEVLLNSSLGTLRYLEINQCTNLSKEFVHRSLRYRSNALRIVGVWIPTECSSVTARLV